MEVFRRFSNQSFMKQPSFDPIFHQQHPPENCGYGRRRVYLDRALERLVVLNRNSKVNTVELQFGVEQLVRVSVPQYTSEILEVQKKYVGGRERVGEAIIQNELLVKNSTAYWDDHLQNVVDCPYYQFNLVTTKDVQELIIQGQQNYLQFVGSISALIKNRELLGKLREKIYIR